MTKHFSKKMLLRALLTYLNYSELAKGIAATIMIGRNSVFAYVFSFQTVDFSHYFCNCMNCSKNLKKKLIFDVFILNIIKIQHIIMPK